MVLQELVTENLWNIDKSYLIKEIGNQSYGDVFGIYKDEAEIYYTSYNESIIYLISQYDLYYGKIDQLDIALYIQPDNNSIPVLQDYSSDSLEDIWYEVRKKYKGIPDELKAEKIKSQIVNKGRDIILKNIDNNILESMNTPELRKLISIFSDPKMIETMNSAQKIVNYINDVIIKISTKTNRMKRVLLNLSITDQSKERYRRVVRNY